MTALIPFTFENNPVRTLNIDGEPWFVLADVCRVLEIGNPSKVATRLDSEEKRTLTSSEGGNINGLGSSGAMPTVVNESGLYGVILTSRKPEAKRFKKWVTGIVIPSIRKHGGYIAGQEKVATGEVSRSRILADALLVAQSVIREDEERIATLEADKAIMRPKVEALDRIAGSYGSLCITDAAKTLQIPPRDLFRHLRANGWIYARAGTSDIGYQVRINQGTLEHKVTTIARQDGTEKTITQVRVTPKGLSVLAEAFEAKAA